MLLCYSYYKTEYRRLQGVLTVKILLLKFYICLKIRNLEQNLKKNLKAGPVNRNIIMRLDLPIMFDK